MKRTPKYRCEKCMGIYKETEMVTDGGDLVCLLKCARKWYAISVQSMHEKRVRKGLLAVIKTEGLKLHFGDVSIPAVKVPKVWNMKDGDTKDMMVKEKLYPGYVLVKAFLSDDVVAAIVNTRGVLCLVPTTRSPVPLSEAEVASMLAASTQHEPKPVNVKASVGDRVLITFGTFIGTEGTLESIDGDPCDPSLGVLVKLLGQDTITEVKHDWIRKV